MCASMVHLFRCLFHNQGKGSVQEEPLRVLFMDLYVEFLNRVKDIHRLSALQGHLGWDQEVLMPAKGAASRGK